MINTQFRDRLFFLDILFHLLFSFTTIMTIFIVRFNKIKSNKLNNSIKNVLKTNILDELATPDAEDKTNLKILDSIYRNDDNNNKIKNKSIKKASYNQVIIFGVAVLIIIYFLEDKSNLLSLIFDKSLIFAVLGSTIYLYYIYFKEKYVEVKNKEIYDMINKANKNLTFNVNYL